MSLVTVKTRAPYRVWCHIYTDPFYNSRTEDGDLYQIDIINRYLSPPYFYLRSRR